jgi:hypothetical protein
MRPVLVLGVMVRHVAMRRLAVPRFDVAMLLVAISRATIVAKPMSAHKSLPVHYLRRSVKKS